MDSYSLRSVGKVYDSFEQWSLESSLNYNGLYLNLLNSSYLIYISIGNDGTIFAESIFDAKNVKGYTLDSHPLNATIDSVPASRIYPRSSRFTDKDVSQFSHGELDEEKLHRDALSLLKTMMNAPKYSATLGDKAMSVLAVRQALSLQSTIKEVVEIYK